MHFPSLIATLNRWGMWGLSAGLLLGSAGWLAWASSQTDAQLEAKVQAEIQGAFNQETQRFLAAIESADTTAAGYTRHGFVWLRYDAKGKLVGWNTRDYQPTAYGLRQLRRTQPIDTLATTTVWDQSRIYYAYTPEAGTYWLLPLRIDYPIDNAYLQDYLFLGKWSTSPLQPEFMRLHQLTRIHDRYPITLKDPLHPQQPFLVGLGFQSWRPFRRAMQELPFWAVCISLVVMLLAFRRELHQRTVAPMWASFWPLIAACGLRLWLWNTQWTTQFISGRLFSASSLALDPFNHSLGDFLLNALLVLLLVRWAYRYVPYASLQKSLLQLPVAGQHVVVLMWVALTAGFVNVYARVFDLVVQNADIAFNLADFYQLDGLSFWAFFSMALLVGVLYFLIDGLLRVLAPVLKKRLIWLAFALGIAAAVGVWRVGWPHSPPEITLAFLAFSVTLVTLRIWEPNRKRPGLLPGLLLVLVVAGVMNVGLTLALNHDREGTLHSLARRFADDKNLITESNFDGVLENIRNDSTLWHTDTVLSRLENPAQAVLAQLVNRHLVSAFKSYDHRAYLFQNGRRIDDQFEFVPYILDANAMRQGRTLSANLYQVPLRTSNSQSIYVARIPITSQLYGRLLLQIELHPKTFLAGRLYPELLLDKSIRKRLALPTGYALAIYTNGRLVRREGTADFPLRFSMPLGYTAHHSYTPETVSYAWKPYPEKILLVQSTRRSWFDILTAYSFLTYFLLLLVGLRFLPSWLRQLQANRFRMRDLPFATRIQVNLIGLTLLPLVVVWGLTTPLFETFYLAETIGQLRTNLTQVVSYLENESSFMRAIEQQNGQPDPAAADLITRISDLLAADFNVYTASGDLYLTNRPKIYQMNLTGTRMHPAAFSQLTQQPVPFLNLNENIGELEYFSGYAPLLDASNQAVGFVNLPYLSRQDVLRDQVRQFIAYVLNVFVVVFLVVVVVSLFISRSITNPLRLLRQRLDETQLGNRAEPIQWTSQDEIGSIITSYNQMLAKLEESERKLTRSEREGAWREMARQVAHEIKNPLTPMKLSLQQLMRALKRSEDAQVAQHAERVSGTLLTQIDSLTAIANSFAQFAQLNEPRREPIDLHAVLQEAELLFQEANGCIVRYEPPQARLASGEWLPITGDSNQLGQVVVNLIRNAKQAGATEIVVRAKCTNETVEVEVQDNGAGIPPEVQPRIFEPNFSTKSSGMGLGLAISRRIVEHLNGRIRFVSEPSAGTRFSLRFPLRTGTEPSA